MIRTELILLRFFNSLETIKLARVERYGRVEPRPETRLLHELHESKSSSARKLTVIPLLRSSRSLPLLFLG